MSEIIWREDSFEEMSSKVSIAIYQPFCLRNNISSFHYITLYKLLIIILWSNITRCLTQYEVCLFFCPSYVVSCVTYLARSHREISVLYSKRRYGKGILSALLVFCEKNPPATGGFPNKGPVMLKIDVLFVIRRNKLWDKQSIYPWWRHQMKTFSALLTLCAGNSPVPVNSPHKGQWRGTLMFSLICAWINDWVNNREAGDLRRHLGHYDVNVMSNLRRHDAHVSPL